MGATLLRCQSSPSSASCWRLSAVSLARLLLVFDRNTPSLTSVPSSSVSTWALETVTEPVRALYCRQGFNAPFEGSRIALAGLRRSLFRRGVRLDTELLQELALHVPIRPCQTTC